MKYRIIETKSGKFIIEEYQESIFPWCKGRWESSWTCLHDTLKEAEDKIRSMEYWRKRHIEDNIYLRVVKEVGNEEA